jgi:hypothetical protein
MTTNSAQKIVCGVTVILVAVCMQSPNVHPHIDFLLGLLFIANMGLFAKGSK